MGKPYLKIIDDKLGTQTNVNFSEDISSSLANIDKILMNFKNKNSLASNLMQVGYQLPQKFDFKIIQDKKPFNVLYGDNPVTNYFSNKFVEENYKPSKDTCLTSFRKRCLEAIVDKNFRKHLYAGLDPKFDNMLLDSIDMYRRGIENDDFDALDTASRNFFNEFEKYSTIRNFSEIVYDYNANYGGNINILTPSIEENKKDIKIDMFKTNFDVFYLTNKRKTKAVLNKEYRKILSNPKKEFLDNPNQNKLDIWTLEEMQEFLPHDELEELNDNINFGRIR